MTELWLIRHGQTDWNLIGRWQGQVPYAPGLNDLGHAQALAVRDQLMDKHFSAIYTSDLLRARQTADLIAEPLGLTVILEPRLREMNLGAWEGMLSSDIEVQYPYEIEKRKKDPLHAHTPNGESLLEVSGRVIEAINEITSKHPDRSVLVVSHGVSLAVIICRTE
jgi:broad specificity phosphatase PhoE